MTTATTTPTVADAVRRAFPFSVDKFRLSGPENMRTPHFGLFRSDTLECVGNACRASYEPHTTDDVIALAEAAAAGFDLDGGDFVVGSSFKHGHYLTIGPTREHRRSICGTKDDIWPRFILHAGYNGKCFDATLGVYRDACQNLSMIRSAGEYFSASFRHTNGLRDKIADLTETFRELATGWDSIVQTIEAMNRREVDLAEFVSQVYPLSSEATPRTERSYAKRARRIVERVWRERAQLGTPSHGIRATAWEAYNAVQGYVQHEATRKGRPDAATRAFAALGDPAVERALVAALAA